jgi:hypothetical protein
VLGVEFLLPGKEVLDGHWSKSSKFGSFEHFHFFSGEALLNFQRSALDQVLMDPVSGLFDNIEDDRLLLAATDDFLYFFDDIVDVVSGDACDGLDLVLERCEGVLLGVLEHEVDLVLHRVALERFAQDVELVGCRFLDNMEFIQIDVLEGCELVPL